MGETLKLVWAEFSTLSQADFIMSPIALHAQACSHLELKTRPRFCLVSLSLSMQLALQTNSPVLGSSLLGLKSLPRTNNLAYCAGAPMMTRKKFFDISTRNRRALMSPTLGPDYSKKVKYKMSTMKQHLFYTIILYRDCH